MRDIKNISALLFTFFVTITTTSYGQNEDEKPQDNTEGLDASKLINFYSFIDNTLEYSSQEFQNSHTILFESIGLIP